MPSLSERKKQISRILTYLEGVLGTRDEWEEQEFWAILDQIDEREAKRTSSQVSLPLWLQELEHKDARIAELLSVIDKRFFDGLPLPLTSSI
jgi:hypothetical protein